MKTILDILARAGGYRRGLYLKVENPPYLDLVIEATPDLGPLGQPALSVAQYGTLNGDLMRDPEMCFEFSKPLGGRLELDPYYWRNDYAHVEQTSRTTCNGSYIALLPLHRAHLQFATWWDNNLHEQGFLDAFSDKPTRG